MAKCDKCGATIVFISLPSGKVMACNDQIAEGMKNPEGKDILVTDKGEIIHCEYGPVHPPFSVPVYGRIPHHVTCPYSHEND